MTIYQHLLRWTAIWWVIIALGFNAEYGPRGFMNYSLLGFAFAMTVILAVVSTLLHRLINRLRKPKPQ